MEELIVKKYARILGIMCLAFLILIASMPELSAKVSAAYDALIARWEEAQLEKEREIYKQFIKDTKKEEEEPTDIMIPGTIRIPVAEGLDVDSIEFDNDFMNHTLTIFFPGMNEDILKDYPMVGNPDHIDNLGVSSDKKGLYIQFMTDTVIEPTVEYQDDYMFLTLNVPGDIYDRIVVIDAGHGGKMPGMVVSNIKEKDVTLEIVNRIKALFDEDTSVKVYYTRLTDEDIPLEARVGLANDLNADLFLSVHLNSFGQAFNDTHGTMTMFNELLGSENNRSRDFAKIVNDALVSALGTRNLGVVNGSTIYIIREAKVPVALTELAFMSNRKELEMLTNEEKQELIARTLYEAIIKAFDEGF